MRDLQMLQNVRDTKKFIHDIGDVQNVFQDINQQAENQSHLTTTSSASLDTISIQNTEVQAKCSNFHTFCFKRTLVQNMVQGMDQLVIIWLLLKIVVMLPIL